MTINVLIVAHFDKQWVERIQRLSSNIHITLHPIEGNARVPDDLWRDTEVAYTFANHLPAPDQAPNLRWVQLYSAGADMLLKNPLFQTDVEFTTMSGIHAVPIGEYVITVMLAWFHRLPTILNWQRQGIWPKNAQQPDAFEREPEEVRDKTIGIVGYGSIGREVARVAKALGMHVLAMQHGNDHHDSGFVFPGIGDPDGIIPEEYYHFEQLSEMLPKCDIVVIGVPLTEQTRHMFNETAFAAMKKSTLLINIARGGVCDEQALITALQNKQIAGAALDVFEKEPLPGDSPLWKLSNVILSPHISGLSSHYNERASTVFEENLRHYLHKEKLYNLVDKERGY